MNKNFFSFFVFLFAAKTLFSYQIEQVAGADYPSNFPKVRINNLNQGLMVWSRKKGGVQYSFFNSKKSKFESALILSETGGSVQLALSDSGLAIVAWTHSSDVYYRTINLTDKSISPIYNFNLSAQLCSNISISMNKNNQAILAFNSGGGVKGGQIYYANFDSSTGQFSTPNAIGNAIDGNFSPNVKINNLGFALMIWNLGGSNGGAINFSKKEIGSNTFDPPSAVATRAGATNFQPILGLNNSSKGVSGWDAVVQNQVNQQGDFLFLDFDLDYSSYPSFSSFSTIYPRKGIHVFSDVFLNDANQGVISFLIIELLLNLDEIMKYKDIDKSSVVKSYIGYANYNNSQGTFDAPLIIPGTGNLSYLPALGLNQELSGFMAWNTGGTDDGGNIEFSFYGKKSQSFSNLISLQGSSYTNVSATFNDKNIGAIAFNDGAKAGGGIYYVIINGFGALGQYSRNKLILQRGYPQ